MTALGEAQGRKLKRGIIAAFEGIDGAGKSTQARMLCERLRDEKYAIICLHEPTDGLWGEKIRALAKNGRDNVTAQTEMEYFYNDRIEDVKNNIRPALEAKKIVIMDRYYFSSVAYQGARGINPTYIEERNKLIAPEPDVAFILDLSPHTAIDRIIEKRKTVRAHNKRERSPLACRNLARNIRCTLRGHKICERRLIREGSLLVPSIKMRFWPSLEGCLEFSPLPP